MNQTRTFVTAVSLLSFFSIGLTACSSSNNTDPLNDPANLPPMSSEGGVQGVYNANASLDVFACEAPYYLELRGLYIGDVSYIPAGAEAVACVWEASLQVRGSYDDPSDTRQCALAATYRYQLKTGESPCVDGSLDAPLSDPLAASPNQVDWEKPEWPVDLPMQIAPDPTAGTSDESILPAGAIDAANRQVRWRFDGLGDTVIVDGTAGDGIVTGTLVKR